MPSHHGKTGGLLLACSLAALVALPSSAAAGHGADLDCSDFADQRAAQGHLASHPGDPDRLDGDSDGRACESLPCPCAGNEGRPDRVPAKPSSRRPAGSTKTFNGRVVRVIDGDTLKVRLGGRTVGVRLIGIDTPETRKPGVGVECGGREATRLMKKLAVSSRGRGRRVIVRTDATQDRRDRYGRLLAYVTTRQRVGGRKRNLGLEQIRAGWTKRYVFERRFSQYRKFSRSQTAARRAGRGAWSKCRGDFHSEQ